MAELMSVFTNIGRLVAFGVGGVSIIVIAYAGFQYATASGDPQKVGQAKNAFIGAFIGMLIASLAFIGPRILTDVVIKPVGGVAMEQDVGLNCDGVLKNQLIFQRAASTPSRMNVVISQIQNNQNECASDIWSPEVLDPPENSQCWASTAADHPASGTDRDVQRVGEGDFPESLLTGSGATAKPRLSSGRDDENNVIVYWSSSSDDRPSDQASCWLYLSRLRVWHHNYFE